MKKKWIALGTTLVLAGALAIPAMAANGIREIKASLRSDITIVLDGKEQTLKTTDGETIYPLMYNGTTYLPLRTMGQLMGKDVAWENETKTITLTSDGYTANNTDGSKGSTDIGLEKAKEIALEDAGLKESQVIFVTTKADYDDGRKEYEVEFYCDGTEYDYEIDAATGKIVSFDKDFEGKRPVTTETTVGEITAEEAKAIALKHAGLTEGQVSKLKVERDRDDGIVKYEVEFEKGTVEYDYEINAATGNILKAEKDMD